MRDSKAPHTVDFRAIEIDLRRRQSVDFYMCPGNRAYSQSNVNFSVNF